MRSRTVMVAAVLLVAGMAGGGCATGLGRALSHAFSGTPESVVDAYDLVETDYLRVSNMIIKDIREGKATTDLGKVRQAAMLKKAVEAQQAVVKAIGYLREYHGAESGDVAAAARDAAMNRWNEVMDEAMTAIGLGFDGGE